MMKIELGKEAVDELIYLRKLSGLNTESEVIRAAISLFKFISEKTNRGDKVLVKSSKTGKYEEIIKITGGRL